MSTYEARQAKKRELESLSVEELERRCQETTEKRRDLEDEEQELERALREARERRERERPDTLTAKDENILRRELTIVGRLLENDDNSYGGFTLKDEDPKTEWAPEAQWTLHIDTAMTDVYESPALSTNVTLKTKNARVRAIVREMITSTEHIHDRDKHEERTHWNIHWDYYNRIELKNPVTSDMYYEKRKTY